MAEKKRGRGRPPVYVDKQLESIVALLKSEGNVARTCRILRSRNGVVGLSKAEKAAAVVRKAAGFPNPLKISQPTLLKIAKNAGVKLAVGRPKNVEAETAEAA